MAITHPLSVFPTVSPVLDSFIAPSLLVKRALDAASLSLALLFGGGSIPANAISGGVADFVDIHDQDLSGKKVSAYIMRVWHARTRLYRAKDNSKAKTI